MLWHLGLCWFWRDCPSQDSQFQREQRTWTGPKARPSHANQLIQDYTPPTFSIRFSYSGPLSTGPNHPRAWYQTNKDSPCATESTELSQTVQPWACLPCLTLIPSHRKQNKGTFPLLLLSLCLLTDPGAALGGPAQCGRPLLLGTVTNYLFSGSCLLICWPHNTSSFLVVQCILKQQELVACLIQRYIDGDEMKTVTQKGCSILMGLDWT